MKRFLTPAVVIVAILSLGAMSVTPYIPQIWPISRGGTGAATKSAAFDALSPMTTGGDLIYGGASGTGTRLANGTSGQFLKSNGGTNAPSWATTGSTQAVTSKTANYTLVAGTDQVVTGDASGGAFAFTLPTAVGNTGQIFTMVKITASTAKITINTTSSQTIGTYASGALSLDFLNERLSVISDGSNWQVLDWGYPEVQYTLSVSGDNSWSTIEATGVVRKTIDQLYRISFNIVGSTASSANVTITISNITFDATSNNTIAVAGGAQGGAAVDGRCKTVVNTGQITVNASAASTQFGVSGEVKLEGKPGFAL